VCVGVLLCNNSTRTAAVCHRRCISSTSVCSYSDIFTNVALEYCCVVGCDGLIVLPVFAKPFNLIVPIPKIIFGPLYFVLLLRVILVVQTRSSER